MKKITKRIMAFVLSLVMMLGCIPSFINEASAVDLPSSSSIKDLLPIIASGFPSTLEDAWVNSNGYKVYYSDGELKFNGHATSSLGYSGTYCIGELEGTSYKFVDGRLVFNIENGILTSISSSDGSYGGTYEPVKTAITKIVLTTNNGMNPTLGEGMPNLNPVESKQRPLTSDIFDTYISYPDDGWYLTQECDEDKCTGAFQKDTTYYYKRHYEIVKTQEYVFADSISIDFVSDSIQYELISDTADSKYIHTLIIKIIPSKKIYSLNGTETLSYLNMIMSMNDIDYDYFSVTGHRGVYYVVCNFTKELDLYGSIKFKGNEYISNIKDSKPSDEEIFNEKCFIINGDPGFDAYFVYDWSKIENITFTQAPEMTVADVLARLTNSSGTLSGSCICPIIDDITHEDALEASDKLEAGKKYKLCVNLEVSSEGQNYVGVKINGSDLTYVAGITKDDDGWESNNNYLEIKYTFECKNPSSGSSSKKYKAIDDKKTTEKITGAGKKGSKRTIIPEPNRKVESVIVTDKDGNKYEVTNEGDGTYSFIQPGTNVDVEVKYKNRLIELTIGSLDASVDDVHHNLDVVPKVVNDRTMLPIRFVAENLGAKVDWDEKDPDTVIITRGDTKIVITLGSDKAYVNGQEYILDSVAFAENDRTYLPVRFVSEKLNAIVEWNEAHPMDVKIYERQ
ncbi:MAG: copper amine oxidase N-terminal domain-containing protein [Bacilli bacterium]|nr:copper amine oxidase N-terminal domain-containing protein [Bacilli bacterium]